jgi:hypothetical protein
MTTRLSVAASVLLVTACAVAGVVAVADKPESPLPKDARKALDKKWPGWQMAAIDPASASCLADQTAARAVVEGDFDSDGRADIGAAIQTPQGVRLVAMTWREWGYEVYDLDSLGDKMASAYLGRERPGAKFLNPNTQLDDYFPTDTLAAYTCSGGRTAYLWTGLGFRKIVIGNKPPQPVSSVAGSSSARPLNRPVSPSAAAPKDRRPHGNVLAPSAS